MRARFRSLSTKRLSVVAAAQILVLWVASTRFGFRWQLSDRNSISIRGGIASFERMIGRDDQIAYSQSLHGKTNSISVYRYSSGSLRSQFTRPQCDGFMYCVCGGNMPMWRTFNLPFWLPFIAAATPAALMCLRDRRRRAPGHCRKCNYNLTANESGRCPECGTNVPPKMLGDPNSPNMQLISAVTWVTIFGATLGASINCAFECDKWVSRAKSRRSSDPVTSLHFEKALGLPAETYTFQVTPELLVNRPELRPLCESVIELAKAELPTGKVVSVSVLLLPSEGMGWPFETTAPTYSAWIEAKKGELLKDAKLDREGNSPVRRIGWILNTGTFASFFGMIVLLVNAARRTMKRSPRPQSPTSRSISQPATCASAT